MAFSSTNDWSGGAGPTESQAGPQPSCLASAEAGGIDDVGAWSQESGGAAGPAYDVGLRSHGGRGSQNTDTVSGGRSDNEGVILMDGSYIPILDSSQFASPSNYFSVWSSSGTAPRPIPLSSSTGSTSFTPSKVSNPSTDTPSSSASSEPAAPLSRYAQLVQAKMRNTIASPLASSSVVSESSSWPGRNSNWAVAGLLDSRKSLSPPETGVWENAAVDDGRPRMDQLGDQFLVDFQQGNNVCNTSFIGYNDKSALQSRDVGAGPTEAPLAIDGAESSTRGGLSRIIEPSPELFQRQSLLTSPSSTASSVSSWRKEKRERGSGEGQAEKAPDGLWGMRRPSPPSSEFVSSIPSGFPPTIDSQYPSSPSSSPEFTTSNWLPASSKSTFFTSSYLPPSSASTSTATYSHSSYLPSAYQLGTGYVALLAPVVGPYPSVPHGDGPWWDGSSMSSYPQVDASFVQSVYGPVRGGFPAPYIVSGDDQQQGGSSSSEDRYSYIAATQFSNDSGAGNRTLSRYQQLMAVKFGQASNPSSSLQNQPSSTQPSSTAPIPAIEPSTLAFSSSSSLSPPSPLNDHLRNVSPLQYSQYPISLTPSYANQPLDYPPTSADSALQSARQTRPNSSSVSSYFQSPLDGMHSQESYLSSGAGAGAADWEVDQSAQGKSRNSSRCDDRSSTSLNIFSIPPGTSSYGHSLPLSHLPPPSHVSAPHRSTQSSASASAHPSLEIVVPPPSQSQEPSSSSLLLPSAYSHPEHVPIRPRPHPHPSSGPPAYTPSSMTETSFAPTSSPCLHPFTSSLPATIPSNHSLRVPRSSYDFSISLGSSSSSSQSAMLSPPLHKPSTVPAVSSSSLDSWESVAPAEETSLKAPNISKQPRAKKARVAPSTSESGAQEEREGGSSAESSSKADERAKKKKKLLLACHFCRGRKLKCDGDRNQCANCVQRGTPCTYDSEIRRRGPGRKKIPVGGGEREASPFRDPNSTASKPTRMKGVGSGHGAKMAKVKREPVADSDAPSPGDGGGGWAVLGWGG